MTWNAWAINVDELKSAYIFKFTNYIVWPTQVLNSGSFKIVVEGDKNLLESLRKVTNGKTVASLPIKVEEWPGTELSDAHILYLTQSSELLKIIQTTLKKKPLVVITTKDEFSESDIVVNFTLDGEKLRFELSNSLAKNKGLEISSQLLKLAKTVK